MFWNIKLHFRNILCIRCPRLLCLMGKPSLPMTSCLQRPCVIGRNGLMMQLFLALNTISMISFYSGPCCQHSMTQSDHTIPGECPWNDNHILLAQPCSLHLPIPFPLYPKPTSPTQQSHPRPTSHGTSSIFIPQPVFVRNRGKADNLSRIIVQWSVLIMISLPAHVKVVMNNFVFSLLQSENMEALVQLVVGPPEDTDEKTRFKYVSCWW